VTGAPRWRGPRAGGWAVVLLLGAVVAGASAPTGPVAPGAGRLPATRSGLGPGDRAGALDPVALSRHRVVGLGDSVVSGSHCQCEPFVSRYAGIMARRTGSRVSSHNLGVPGLTTVGLLSQLDRPEVVEVVRRADLVTVTIGANDMGPARRSWALGTCTGCFRATGEAIRDRVAAVLRRVDEVRAGRRTEVLVTTYWNVFEEATEGDGHPRGYAAMARRATRRTNDAVCDAARDNGAECVDLYAPFKGNGADPLPLLAADRDHPNSAGHAVIAATLARHGWRELGLTR
jgi:lysophospholipase L1-like esterase